MNYAVLFEIQNILSIKIDADINHARIVNETGRLIKDNVYVYEVELFIDWDQKNINIFSINGDIVVFIDIAGLIDDIRVS